MQTNNAATGGEQSSSVAETIMPLPDEAALRRDLVRGNFKSGEARGRWKCLSIQWPYVWVAITAAQRGPASPELYTFRLDCTGYPHQAPTGQPWDMARNVALEKEKWPGGTGRFAIAFNPDWKHNGVSAIYLPCDRLALATHPEWRSQHAPLAWQSDKDITFYLGIIHDYLNSPEYTGSRSPAT